MHAAFGFLLLAFAALLFWHRWRMRRLLRSLDRMLDTAIQGTFREENFDEGLLSAVESRLAHYLSAGAVSAERLQEERNKIQALVADVSHQAKTPIANILLYTQLLEEQVPECREYTAALGGQARKLRFLIEALVKTSRLETGILVLHPRSGSLEPMLEEAVAQFSPRAEEKGLTLTLASSETEAVFDPKWTAEAVCNLIDNAVKYTPGGGRVTVRARAYELFSRIDVEDTGPGVPESEQGKLFQRFYRGTTASDAEGVGVGLYLVRQIAEGQGGFVKVFSRPGRGTRFSLYLPRDGESAPSGTFVP